MFLYSVDYFLTWTLHWPIINKMFTNITFLRLRGIIRYLYNIFFIVFAVLLIRVISLTGSDSTCSISAEKLPARGNGAGHTSKTRCLPTARHLWCHRLKRYESSCAFPYLYMILSFWQVFWENLGYMFIAMGYTWETLSGLTHEAFW